MNAVLLALDGGATKTAVKVLTSDGTELLSIIGSGVNYQAIGEAKVTDELSHLFQQVAQLKMPIQAAVFAIAGIDTTKDLAVVQQMVANSIAKSQLSVKTYVVENDVEATMRGLCQNGPGALVISGTGAIGYGFDGKETFRVGGWGHRVGDEGSGYWIGQAVVQAIFKAADGRGKQTVLTDYVLAQQQFQQIEELMNWLYRDDYRNADLASFGSLLQRAVEEGDEVAQTIAQKAAAELTNLSITLVKKLSIPLTQSFTLYINGGVLKNNPTIYTLLERAIHDFAPNITIKLCDQKPIESIMERAKLLL